jgi:hypothetical protein
MVDADRARSERDVSERDMTFSRSMDALAERMSTASHESRTEGQASRRPRHHNKCRPMGTETIFPICAVGVYSMTEMRHVAAFHVGRAAGARQGECRSRNSKRRVGRARVVAGAPPWLLFRENQLAVLASLKCEAGCRDAFIPARAP